MPWYVDSSGDYSREASLAKTPSFQDDNQTLAVIGIGGMIVIVSLALFFKAYRIKQVQRQQNGEKKTS